MLGAPSGLEQQWIPGLERTRACAATTTGLRLCLGLLLRHAVLDL